LDFASNVLPAELHHLKSEDKAIRSCF
jgi:hypothetical protein